MKRPKLLVIPVVGLFLFFMLAGSGFSGSSAKPKDPTGRPRVESYRHEPNESNTEAQSPDADDEQDPDLPTGIRGSIDKETYLRMRDEYIALRRGIEAGRPFDPGARGRAIDRMEGQEDEVSGKNSFFGSIANFLGINLNAGSVWTELGPAPLPNGSGRAVSGLVTAVIVDPA